MFFSSSIINSSIICAVIGILLSFVTLKIQVLGCKNNDKFHPQSLLYGKNDACLTLFKYEQCQYVQNVIKSRIEIALEDEKAWLEQEKIELIDQMKFTIEKRLEEEKSRFEKEKQIFVDQIRDIKSQVNGLKLELKQTKLKYYTNKKKPHNNKRNGSSFVKNELTEPSSSKLYDVHKWKYPVYYEQLGISNVTNVRNNYIFF